MEDAIAAGLHHPSMTIETGKAKFCDFLGKKLNTVGGVAEDDRLVDLELGEERVETVDLLFLLNKSVVLSNTAKSELVHEVDFIRIGHVLVGEGFHSHWESRTEKHDL